MAPKVSDEYLEERRQQILDAAVASFSRNGLHQTTIEDIRVEAKLSKGAVYHYFKTKEDIIDAIRQRSAGQAEAFYAETSTSEDAMTRLLDLMDTAFAGLVSPRSVEANRLALFLWSESIVNQRIMDGQLDSFSPFLKRMADDVRKAQADGKINPGIAPEGIARAVTGAMLGLQIQLTWEPDIDMAEAERALRAMVTGDYWTTGPLKQEVSAKPELAPG